MLPRAVEPKTLKETVKQVVSSSKTPTKVQNKTIKTADGLVSIPSRGAAKPSGPRSPAGKRADLEATRNRIFGRN